MPLTEDNASSLHDKTQTTTSHDSSVITNHHAKSSGTVPSTSITISVDLLPGSPLGMKLAPQQDATVVTGWERLPSQKLGIIQRSGLVRLGDRLTKINGVNVEKMTFRSIMDLLRQKREQGGLKNLTFDPPGGLKEEEDEKNSRSRLKRFAFSSSIPQARINYDDKSNDKGGYIEYEVLCRLLIRGGSGDVILSDSEEKQWSVWKRFSEFKKLDATLQEAFGWQMDAIEKIFPSSRSLSFLFSPLSTSFVEKRREDLDEYWQSIIQIEEMTDFAHPHRYSSDLAQFLVMEDYLMQNPTKIQRNEALQEELDEPRKLKQHGKFTDSEKKIKLFSNPIIPAKPAARRCLPGIFLVSVMIPGGGELEGSQGMRCGNSQD